MKKHTSHAAGKRANKGLECRRCGASSFQVIYTRQRTGGIVRRRRCRSCGNLIVTWERLAGTNVWPG